MYITAGGSAHRPPLVLPPSSSASSLHFNTLSAGSSQTIQNTETTTIVTVVTRSDGSSGTYTLPPGSSTIVPDTGTAEPPSASTQLPAIIGGAVGGVALLVIILITFLLHRRRSAQVTHKHNQTSGYQNPRFSPVGPQPIPLSPDHVNPYTPLTPGSRDTAPLMVHMNSSNGVFVSNTPETSQFVADNSNNTENSRFQDNQTPAWAVPTAARQGSIDATNYTGSSNTPSAPLTSPGSGRAWSGAGLPPGAMAPRMGSTYGARFNEKARFTLSKPTLAPSSPANTVGLPSYSQG
ncbi:hypothetical protein M408DRAFT_20457 [Serendipita vermifera MAFF 305830]|uniref:Uncharacterized protein n=1 Tax=Serendipita vermifera MAFF 305830 TaxID=933852 RepID=A0A0C3BJ70_SERVB|nr:hypothetical protein M408DRAFT_20457 [Serendipita vermifera MAFF 305830]